MNNFITVFAFCMCHYFSDMSVLESEVFYIDISITNDEEKGNAPNYFKILQLIHLLLDIKNIFKVRN